MILVAPFPHFGAYYLWPCKGEVPEAECDFITKVLSGPAATLVMGWASLAINVRAANERRQLLIKGVGRGTFARVITLVGTFLVVMMTFSAVGGSMPGSKDMKRIADSEDLASKGLTATIMFLQVVRKWCFGLAIASAFTSVVNAGVWLRALRKVYMLFAEEIHAVASSSSEKVDLDAGATAAETRIMDGKDDYVQPSKVGAQIAARNTVKRSFEKIWDLTEAVNEIFALPLSVLFMMLLGGMVSLVYGMITEGDEEGWRKFFMIFITTFLLSMLMWVSSAGDAYWNARDKLLRPDISLGLMDAMGRKEAAVFARSLERTQLGFDIVSVTVTTHKVLYVVFSLLIFAAYIIPKSTTVNV